jgi:hypothetical protein
MAHKINEKFNGSRFPEELTNLPLLKIPDGREYLIYNCVAKLVRIYNNLFGADLIAYSTPKNQAIHVETKQGGKLKFLVHLGSIRRTFNYDPASPTRDGVLGDVASFEDNTDVYVASELLHDFFHQVFNPALITYFHTKEGDPKDHALEEFFIFTYFGDDEGGSEFLRDAIWSYLCFKSQILETTKYPEFYKLVDVALKKFPPNKRYVDPELTNYVKKLYKISHKVFDTVLDDKLERFANSALEAVKEMEKKATKLPKLEDTIEIPKKIPLKDVPKLILELKHVRDLYKGKT